MGTVPLPQATATSGAQPIAGGVKATGAPATPGIPGAFNTPQGAAASNPMVPPTAAGASAATVPGVATDPNAANLSKQEIDMFGKGVGGEMSNLIGNISGVNSQSIADYTASLQPAMATATANLGTNLAAEGVSGNSSVAALGQANLGAQETAAIAGETAQLQQSGQQLEGSLLSGEEQSAAQEVASSGWNVFGQVLGAIGSDAGSIIGGVGKVMSAGGA